MMKTITQTVIVVCLIATTVSAQRNAQWVMGYGHAGVPNGFNDMFVLDFRTPAVSFDIIDTVAYAMTGTNASICDAAGNLLFYSNGISVMNAAHDTMANGKNLTPNCEAYYPNVNGQLGASTIQGTLILPHPTDTHLYYIIHHSFYSDAFSPFIYDYLFCDTIYYSIVDMSTNNGLGSVVLKNQHLWVGNVPSRVIATIGSVTATRHANGRDWWIVMHRDSTNEFMNFLLTPQGFQGPYYQSIGPLCFEFKGQSSFSPDGTKYAFFNYGNSRIHLFDFDRCTGLFSNYINITNINAIHYGSIGVAFSPNSRYFYSSSAFKIAQWDTYATNVANSKVVVAQIDSTPCPNYWNMFYLMQLASDGKIYISSPNSNHCMTVINNPDIGGMGCNAVPRGLAIPRSNASSVPNHPNYELGALAGSPCDTITSTGFDPLPPEGGLDVFPNPSNGSFTIQLPTNSTNITSFKLLDLLGRKVYSQKLSNLSKTPMIALPAEISNGVYFCRVVTDGKVYSEKLVLER